jgi:hypothetical protein
MSLDTFELPKEFYESDIYLYQGIHFGKEYLKRKREKEMDLLKDVEFVITDALLEELLTDYLAQQGYRFGEMTRENRNTTEGYGYGEHQVSSVVIRVQAQKL